MGHPHSELIDCTISHSGDPSVTIDGRIESRVPQESMDSYPGIERGLFGMVISPLVQNWHGVVDVWSDRAMSSCEIHSIVAMRIDSGTILLQFIFMMGCSMLFVVLAISKFVSPHHWLPS